MDPFFATLIKNCKDNQYAPDLLGIVEARDKTFSKRMGKIAIPPMIKQWCARMDKRQHDKYGMPYMVYQDQPMTHDMALMCLRYGMAPEKWPAAMSPDDLVRALEWEKDSRYIPARVNYANKKYFSPIAGGNEMTDVFEVKAITGFSRTGLTTTTPWAGTTAVTVGTQRVATTFNDTIFEVMEISGTGTTGGSEPAWNTTLGAETTDNAGANQVIWQAKKIGPLKSGKWFALYVAAPGETGGGTEVALSFGYGRIPLHPSDSNWTAAAQVSGAGQTDNAVAIQYGTPSGGNWGTITDTGILDRLVNGVAQMYSPLDQAKTVNDADAAPSFPIGTFKIGWN